MNLGLTIIWYTSWFIYIYIYIHHIRQSICSNKTCDSPKVFRFCYPLRRGLMPTCCPMATVPSSNFCGHWWRCWRISFSYNWVPPTKVAFSILHPPVDSVKKTSDLKHFGILGLGTQMNQKEKRVFYNPLWFLMSSAVLFIGRLTLYIYV